MNMRERYLSICFGSEVFVAYWALLFEGQDRSRLFVCTDLRKATGIVIARYTTVH